MPTGSLEKALGKGDYKLAFGVVTVNGGTPVDVDTGFEGVENAQVTVQASGQTADLTAISGGTISVDHSNSGVDEDVHYIAIGQ